MKENNEVFKASITGMIGASHSARKNLDVVYQDKVDSAELNRFPANAFTIIILDKCEVGECITDVKNYSLNSRQLFVHLPKREYIWKLAPDSLGRRLIVNDSILETFSPTLRHTFSPSANYQMIQLDDEAYRRFSSEFSSVRNEIHSDTVFPELINARVRVLALMINLWMEHTYGVSALADPNNLAFRFQTLVEKNYKNHKKVSFYADELCITANYLGVICRKQYKMSALGFIRQRVVLEAKKLLHSSVKSIKEIAFELGFKDISYFTYFFRSLTTYTPKEYRSIMERS